jgi:acetolactate synthase regulatory subunit
VRGRHVTTGVTLLVLLAILVAGGLYGIESLLKPVPDSHKAKSATCTATSVKKGQKIHAHQVQVSVLNAGTRSGLAERTLAALRRRGFRAGEAGNAPSTSTVKKVQVWTTRHNDAGARLVARQFGPKTKVRVVKVSLTPGVDVIVGDNFTKLGKPKKVLVVKKRSAACLPAHSATGAAN